MVIIYADICKKSKIEPGSIEINVEAQRTPDSPVLSGVVMKVRITSKTRKALIEAACRRTEALCPVLFIYKDQIPVKVDFAINAV